MLSDMSRLWLTIGWDPTPGDIADERRWVECHSQDLYCPSRSWASSKTDRPK